jgi:hypothetical protein
MISLLGGESALRAPIRMPNAQNNSREGQWCGVRGFWRHMAEHCIPIDTADGTNNNNRSLF